MSPVQQQPARVLGTFDATCIVVGAIIGVGIFFTPSTVARLTGSGGLALAAWAIAGGVALCGALVFAELGARYHASGAQYQVLRDAYGPCPAFLFVFCNATAIQAGAVGVIAVICARNLISAAGAAPDARLAMVLACVLIVSVIAANIAGVRWGSGIQNFTVVAKVLTLVAVAGVAAIWGREPVLASGVAAPLQPAMSPFAGVLAAMVPAFFSYGGWQHALWISGEVKEPRRTLPRAIVVGVLVVVTVYLLANWAYLRLLGVDGVAASGALAADAVAVAAPGLGARLVAAAVAVSAFGVLNAQLLSGPRLVYGMARDRLFFRVFARVGRSGTPVAAILLIGLMALALLLSAGGDAGVDRLLSWVVLIDGVFFALTGAALMVLRRKLPKASEGFRVPGYPVIPLIFILGAAGVVVGASLNPALRGVLVVGAGWIAAAALVYLIWFRSPGRPAETAP